MHNTLIIAEAGVNHNGSLELAKEMARVAKECGADVVKYQTFNVDDLVSKKAQMANYQKENTGIDESQKEMLKKLILTHEEFEDLFRYCKKIGIKFLSTPFDIESVEFLESIGCDLWKIPSGEITNYPYLVKIAQTAKPIILSTGMSTLQEVRDCMTVLCDNGAKDISLLHCTTQYPTPYSSVNLNAMNTLKEEFGVKIGYSDHTSGIEIPIAAVAMGACIIEKHFTLDKNMEGPDHKASLEPDELRHMTNAIRNIEAGMGDGVKSPSTVEIENMAVVRKSIIARKAISKGDILTEDNITTKRPGYGISPMRWNNIIGTRATRDYDEDDLIEES